MKAEDTLMTFEEQTEEMKTAKVKPGCLVRKQAEITWDIAYKAGFEEGRMLHIETQSIRKSKTE